MSLISSHQAIDAEQLNESLARIFDGEGQRIVFWHDPAREFLNSLLFVSIDGVELVRLDHRGGLETKLLLERENPSGRFLIYSPDEEPEYADDWLLDIRLYSRSFRADRASIILDELGLENQHLRDYLAGRRKYFDNKERLQRLKPLVLPDDTAEGLDRKMISVLVRSDPPEFFNIVRTLYHAYTEGDDPDDVALGQPPDCWDDIEKFDLAESFWQMAGRSFGYHDESPTLRNLLIRLLVTDFRRHLRGAVPQSLEHLVLPKSGWSNAIVCLGQWRDSSSRGSSYDVLSAKVAAEVGVDDLLGGLEVEDLLEVMTFLGVEKALMSLLRDRVLATVETVDSEAIRAIATQRCDGHWASLSVIASPTVRRKALHAVYDAIGAASELFALKNQYPDGFSFDDASAMYRAYENELYRFDQLYRHFCEAADVVEAEAWDVLKKVRSQVEAVYVNWYLVHSSVRWGGFVDGSSPERLLSRWAVEGVPNQYEFFATHVQPKLDEAENRRAFVIISDAFRYEAAQELTGQLNGKYRFEAELSSQLGVLPSYTALGMASLLPHSALQYKDNGDVLVDGKPTASFEQRGEVLARVDGMSCRAENLIAMKKAEGRQFVSGKKVVYVYHNAVDVVGDSQNEIRTLTAVRTAIDELSALVSYVINSLNGNYVVVTADHGFLFTETAPDETFRSAIEEKPEGTIKATRRYLIGRDLPDIDFAWHGKTSETARAAGCVEFWIPRGCNRFRFTGSKLFMHGGAMLQEVVVPVITVRHVKGKSVGDTQVKPVTVHVLGRNHRITAPRHRFELLQMEPIGERVKTVTLKVAVYLENEPVTDIASVTFDSASADMDERKKWVHLVLKDQAYDKKTKYRLVLRDADTGIDREVVDVIIDRAISDDF